MGRAIALARRMNTPVIHIWQSAATATAHPASAVLPDGCRDLIFAHKGGARPCVRLSPRATALFTVRGEQNLALEGHRFAPHITLDPALIPQAFHEDMSTSERSARIAELARPVENLGEALACIAGELAPVSDCAKRLGVSARSLERLFRKHRLPPPVYWLQLARARQAGATLGAAQSLAAHAASFGYADQAHMSRQIKAHFGLTPAQLKAKPALCTDLAQPGFATGEQISIR